jgi:hypothetical protein
MLDDEPVTNARNSVREILLVVERTMQKQLRSPRMQSTPMSAAAIPPATDYEHRDPHMMHQSIRFPSLNNMSSSSTEQLIYFSDLDELYGGNTSQVAHPLPTTSCEVPLLDPFPHFNYNILTTDLYNFFPFDIIMPPELVNCPSSGN